MPFFSLLFNTKMMDSKNIAIISLILSGIVTFIVVKSYMDRKKAEAAHKECSCSGCSGASSPDPSTATPSPSNTQVSTNGGLQPMA